MNETTIVIGMVPTGEYFCRACKQLRLSFIRIEKCGNCESTDIVIGVVGSLDKAKLLGDEK